MRGLFIALMILSSFAVKADEVRLHMFRSPLGINWKNPWTLTVSAVKNSIAPVGKKESFSISHVAVEVKCDSIDKHIYRGMTSAPGDEDRELVFKKKYGLGTLFHTYKGRLEKDEEIIEYTRPYRTHKRRAEIGIKISPATCERLLAYAQEYEDLGYGNMYAGFHADPLKGEGAGCSAFVISFLRVGGLMDDFMEEWKQVIDVPLRFVGGPLTQKKVSIFYILKRPRARWSSKEPHIHMEAWDPELMHSWVKRTYYALENGHAEIPWNAEASREGKSLKIELDMSERPTPSGPFWL